MSSSQASLNLWNVVYLWALAATVVFSALSLFSSFRIWHFANKVTAEQAVLSSAKDAQLAKDLAAANVDIANAKAAGDAANSIAATANKTTEALRKENLELLQRISPRRLPQQIPSYFLENLPSFPGKTVEIVSYSLDVESASLGLQIVNLVTSLKMDPVNGLMSRSALGSLASGIWISGSDGELASSFVKFFSGQNIAATLGEVPEGSGLKLDFEAGRSIDCVIFVGVKPLN